MSNTSTQTLELPDYYRDDLLKYGAHVVPDPSDAASVAAAATVLAEWVTQAASQDDISVRMAALYAQRMNTIRKTKTAAEFIAQAEILYAYTTAAG